MTAAPTVTLEHCICGECFDCPDGYHGDQENGPCICTPDCIVGVLGDFDDDGKFQWFDADVCPNDPQGQHHVGCGC